MTKKLAQKFATKLQLIPLSSASIHPFPSRSFLEINFTASKLNGQVPTTTAILTVHHLVNWKRNPSAGQEQTRKEKLLWSKSVMYGELLSPHLTLNNSQSKTPETETEDLRHEIEHPKQALFFSAQEQLGKF